MTYLRIGLIAAVLSLFSVGCGGDDDGGDDSDAGSGGMAGSTSAGSGGGAGVSGSAGAGGADPSCEDGERNGTETDVDCGGDRCDDCAIGDGCETSADCESAACGESGTCVECLTADECPGEDGPCSTRTCNDGVCGTEAAPAGTELDTQTVGDCQRVECDGAGEVRSVTDDADVPQDDNPCTSDLCTDGEPSELPVAEGTSCGTSLVCDGEGNCVGCAAPANCPGTDTDCRTRTCVDAVCGFSNRAAGTATATQTAGDCKVNECDGNGNVRVVALDSDAFDDGNVCNNDLCSGGTPLHVPRGRGLPCGGGNVCDGASRCVQCLTPSTCPGQDNACQARTCGAEGTCGIARVAAGTPISAQTAGDCKEVRCDGNGNAVTANQDLDRPNDANLCTGDVCTAGAPSNPPLDRGDICGEGLQCDGAGSCVQCLVPNDCPGQDTPCRVRSCSGAGVCGFAAVPASTPNVGQSAGDCRILRCDGDGGEVIENDDADLPIDGNVCTGDVCTDGVPSHPPVPATTACGTDSQCDGEGHCVGCLDASDCPGEDTECQTRTCIENVCGIANAGDGTPLAAQTAGDCLRAQCNGQGNVESVADDDDVPVDENACTEDVCTAGIASNPVTPSGTPCGDDVCDGEGQCVECLTAAHCGVDSACQTHVCAPDHTCGVVNAGDGTPTTEQITGDCRRRVCDGEGGIASVNDDADVALDANVCTDDVCNAGTPEHPPRPSGFSCGGTDICDGQTHCCPAGFAYCDDFEDGNSDGWTRIEQTSSQPGVWVVGSEIGHGGETTFDFQQSSRATPYHYMYPAVEPSGGPWGDQTVSVWIKPLSPITSDLLKVGLCARFTTGGNNDTTSAYCMFMRSDGNNGGGRIQLSKKLAVVGGSQSTIGSIASGVLPFAVGEWHKLTLTVTGTTTVSVTAAVDDMTVGGAVDSTNTILTGGPALVARQAEANFDDVLLSSP